MFNAPLLAVEDFSTSEIMEAQKDMAAFMQYSVQYRFSEDLKVGDKVEYKQADIESDETIYELEVIEKTKDGIWIVEKFDGNEIHVLVDLTNKKLLDLWGYDEDGNKHEPKLLTEVEVKNRIEKMCNSAKAFITETKWNLKEESKIIEVSKNPITCSIYKIDITEAKSGNFTKEQIEILEEKTTIYKSNAVPKLIPSLLLLQNISFINIFDNEFEGLVKYPGIELKDYIGVIK